MIHQALYNVILRTTLRANQTLVSEVTITPLVPYEQAQLNASDCLRSIGGNHPEDPVVKLKDFIHAYYGGLVTSTVIVRYIGEF